MQWLTLKFMGAGFRSASHKSHLSWLKSTATGISEERYDDLEDELEDADADECGITSELHVHINGQKIANPYEGHFGVEDAKDVRSYRLGEPGKYYYVKIMEESGLWLKAQSNETFDSEKLQIEIFDYVLPDKVTIRLAEPSYNGSRDNFGFTDVNVQEDYVIYPDSGRHEIKLLADDVRFGDAI